MECPHCHRQTSPHSNICGSCSGIIPPAQHLLEESGIIAPASPTRSVPSKQVQIEQEDNPFYRMATLGDRLIAFTLDSTFLCGVFAMVDAWAFMRWGIVDGTELKLTLAVLLVAESLNAAIFFLYLWLMEAGFGATLGKAMVGIRVVQTTERNRLAALAIRNLFRAGGRARLLSGGYLGCRLLPDASATGGHVRRHCRDRRTLRLRGKDRRHSALVSRSSGRRLVCSPDLRDQRRTAISLPEPGSCPGGSKRKICIFRGR